MRVGIVIALAVILLMVIIFAIGSEQRIFSSKARYRILLTDVSGLAEGNPVQMSGVTVGSVEEITLPSDPSDPNVRIRIWVQEKYAERIRTDSRVKVRKLGLIAADSLIDVTAGSPDKPVLPEGSIIPSAKSLDTSKLLASGEDLVDNLVTISYSLKNILGRVDRGEGLLGELTTDPGNQQKITTTLLNVANRADDVLQKVQSGDGLAGRLIYDDDYGQRVAGALADSADSVRAITASLQQGFETGEGAIPALLSDPEGRRNVSEMLANLRVTSENLAAFSAGFQTGEGLVPRLMGDAEYAEETLAEFQQLVARLNDVARKLQEGEGTLGRLVDDPSIYEAINDVIIGVNESRLLRWLIRNRQQAGIETRADAARTEGSSPTEPMPEPEPPEEAPEELPEEDDLSEEPRVDDSSGSGEAPPASRSEHRGSAPGSPAVR